MIWHRIFDLALCHRCHDQSYEETLGTLMVILVNAGLLLANQRELFEPSNRRQIKII